MDNINNLKKKNINDEKNINENKCKIIKSNINNKKSINQFLADIIRCIHYCLVVFMIISPFSGVYSLMKLQLQISFMLIFRWIFNLGKCQLTVIEKWLRGNESDEQGFIYSIINPILQIREHEFKYVIYIATIILALISYFRLKN